MSAHAHDRILVRVHVLDPDPILTPILIPALSLVDMMTIQDRGLLEVEAMVEVIGKVAILRVDMIKVKDVGIAMINDSANIILWYVLNSAFLLYFQ